MGKSIRVVCASENHLSYNGSKDYKALVEKAGDFIVNQIENTICENPDLVILPEVYDRYNGMDRVACREYYDVRGNSIYERVKRTAAKYNINIVFSAVMDGKDGYMRNRQMFIGRKGEELGVYDKNHLVWEEHTLSNIAFGEKPSVVETELGRLGGVICYDLNFFELCQKYMPLKPDILCFSSMYHGGYMPRDWAFKNRCFFAGAVSNRRSFIVNPVGEYVAESNVYTPYIAANINTDFVVAHNDYNAHKKHLLKVKYGELVDIQVPMGLDAFLITSNSSDISACQMAKELEIELIDELHARGRKQREDFLSNKR